MEVPEANSSVGAFMFRTARYEHDLKKLVFLQNFLEGEISRALVTPPMFTDQAKDQQKYMKNC